MPKFKISDSLILRTLEVCDAQVLCDLIDENRSYLRVWLPWLDANTTVADSENFIRSTLDQSACGLGFQFGIYVNGALVGMCGYHPIDRVRSSVALGYWLAENFTGKGIVSRCTKFLIDYAFSEFKLDKVYIAAAVGNTKSQAVAENLGMFNEGLEREAECLYGKYVDHIRYSILKLEWVGACTESLQRQYLPVAKIKSTRR